MTPQKRIEYLKKTKAYWEFVLLQAPSKIAILKKQIEYYEKKVKVN